MENHKWQWIPSKETSGTNTLEKQLDPSGPNASRGGSIRASAKYVNDKNNNNKKKKKKKKRKKKKKKHVILGIFIMTMLVLQVPNILFEKK